MCNILLNFHYHGCHQYVIIVIINSISIIFMIINVTQITVIIIRLTGVMRTYAAQEEVGKMENCDCQTSTLIIWSSRFLR